MPDIAVCVPVRDEARALPGLFASLTAQHPDACFLVAMVFDGCRDASPDIARACAAQAGVALETVALEPTAHPHAGRARAAAYRLGRRLVGHDGLLLGTDADTRPAHDWVAMSVAALGQADLVCGRIDRRRLAIDAWRVPIETYLDRLHLVRRTIDPVAGDASPSHWHQGGASLGMTARAWDRIGGGDLPSSGEDRSLVHDARLAGLVVRQDPLVRVRTSSRGTGRAVGGLSDALRQGRTTDRATTADRMEHPVDVVGRFHRSAVARRAFPPADCNVLARRIAVSPDAVAAAAARATSADAFVTALPLDPANRRSVPLAEASQLLTEYEGA